MFEIFKLHLWFKWLLIYVLFWILEEVVLRLFIRWWFGRWFYFERTTVEQTEPIPAT